MFSKILTLDAHSSHRRTPIAHVAVQNRHKPHTQICIHTYIYAYNSVYAVSYATHAILCYVKPCCNWTAVYLWWNALHFNLRKHHHDICGSNIFVNLDQLIMEKLIGTNLLTTNINRYFIRSALVTLHKKDITSSTPITFTFMWESSCQ